MCFALQRRALFQHLNFQKWSEHGVFCTFWLRNVLRATTACTFSSLIWPAGSAPAALASLLFDPPEPQIIGKTQCFATFLPFRASASSFFWLFLFSDLLSSNLSLLSASALLCFSSVHIVGSLTSKLPSIISLYPHMFTYIYIYTFIVAPKHVVSFERCSQTFHIMCIYIYTHTRQCMYIYIYTWSCPSFPLFKGCRPCRRPRKRETGNGVSWLRSSVLWIVSLDALYIHYIYIYIYIYMHQIVYTCMLKWNFASSYPCHEAQASILLLSVFRGWCVLLPVRKT